VHSAFRTAEKNRSGPQRHKFPPSRPNLSLCPSDFSLHTTPRPRFVRATYAFTGRTLFLVILLLNLDLTKDLLDSRIACIRIDPYIVSMSGTKEMLGEYDINISRSYLFRRHNHLVETCYEKMQSSIPRYAFNLFNDWAGAFWVQLK